MYLADLRSGALMKKLGEQFGWLVEMGSEGTTTNHELDVARTFIRSYELLTNGKVDTVAKELLARAACFAPGEPIPWWLLEKTLGFQERGTQGNSGELRGTQEGDFSVREQKLLAAAGRKRLVDVGLVEESEEGAIRLHRLVAAFVRRGVEEDKATRGQGDKERDEVRQVVEETMLEEAWRLNKAGYPVALREWESHLRYVTEIVQKRGDEVGAKLGNALGYHLVMSGNLAGARPYFEQALAILEQVLEAEHPDTAAILNNLGYLLQAQGDLAGARPYLERALAIREQVLGSSHPDTAQSLNNLGVLLRAQGDLAGARPY
jgi:hypothetical protein